MRRQLEPAAHVLLFLAALLACKSGTRNDSATDQPGDPPPAAVDKPTPAERRKQARAEVESQFPWVAAVRKNCADYDGAANQIKKSAVFSANKDMLAGTTITGAKGTLATISTNQGGSELRLVVKSGPVEFATESLFAPIKKGTPVYSAVAEMREGQCVVFSATKLKASSMTERSQVCDTDYFANFTAIGPCQ